ncbi:MAG: modification methylase [Anaerolineae bacterium]|nr:modification methylase [Anaerolineae bacterium]
MTQLSFFFEPDKQQPKILTQGVFSHDGIGEDKERITLEENYKHLLEETDEFNRQLVSFQANKTETLHSWIKYREGFSASLVDLLIKKYKFEPDDIIVDPFAGSCTTLLVAKMRGINAVGIELLPHCHLAWEAKSRAFDYSVKELQKLEKIIHNALPPNTTKTFKHLTITKTAFPPQIEKDLMQYSEWFQNLEISTNTKILCQLILTSILEEISYTRKDGQYLRWDGRAKKIQVYNQNRLAKGKKAIKGINKGDLPDVKNAFLTKLEKIITDIIELQKEQLSPSHQQLIKGNTLFELATMKKDHFAGVITSPPYANRYDYTRTYALELAFLDIGDEIFNLRQEQLSCTVENKSKLNDLEEFYKKIGQLDRFNSISEVIQNNKVLSEINTALVKRMELNEINNKGVLPMINQYFSELTFVFAELQRICKSGAYIAFVNDNVRYAGEIIPVDLLSTNLAEQVGFRPVKVFVLPQRKGNSSQQMSKYGRVALRKSITIWQKA